VIQASVIQAVPEFSFSLLPAPRILGLRETGIVRGSGAEGVRTGFGGL